MTSSEEFQQELKRRRAIVKKVYTTGPIVNTDLLEARALGDLPPHMQAAWNSLLDEQPSAQQFLDELLSEAESELVTSLQRELMKFIWGAGLHAIGYCPECEQKHCTDEEGESDD